MKLWSCFAQTRDYSPSGMIVASTEEEAMQRWKQQLEDDGSWYFAETVHEVNEIDGYRVVFRKGKKVSLEF